MMVFVHADPKERMEVLEFFYCQPLHGDAR